MVSPFLRGIKSILWEFYKRRPWRWLFLPLFPILIVFGFIRRKTADVGNNESIRKIVIMHFGAIGDTLMATPAIRALSDMLPKPEITAIVGSRSACDVYLHNDRVKQFIFLQQFVKGDIKEQFHKERPLWFSRLRLFSLYPNLAIKLMLTNYDVGISFGPFREVGTFSNVLFDMIGIPVRVGCIGTHSERLTHRVDPTILDRHWVDIYLEIAKAVTGVPGGETNYDLEYAVSAHEEREIGIFLTSVGLRDDAFLAVIHPGGNTYVNSKLWDAEKFAEAADAVANKYGATVFVTGSAKEIPIANKVAQLMKSHSIVVAGKMKFGEVGALLKRAQLCITNDTSILHLADAVGTIRIISIFGPTDARKIAPRNHRNFPVSSQLECSPCIDLDAGDASKRCWRLVKEECLRTMAASQVVEQI